jgi:ATP-dependent RNA circularization protein (DNA/RNA ligase family)
MEYHKINSIYKRDMSKPNAPFIIGKWAEPSFDYLQNNKWELTEKIDGTNIRVMFNGKDIIFGGKTDNAQIPSHLVNKLNELFLTLPKKKLLSKMFNREGQESNVCLYGEGFGYKIQGKVGVDYLINEVDFCLFDIKVGEWWLERENIKEIAQTLGLKTPAIVGYGTIHEAIALVKKGFRSSFGTAKAEGLVLRPTCELKTRGGQRIITKIKVRDFK